jgi:hypothetical protein
MAGFVSSGGLYYTRDSTIQPGMQKNSHYHPGGHDQDGKERAGAVAEQALE